jgi:hypothetical protein
VNMMDISAILGIVGLVVNVVGMQRTYRQFRYEGMCPRIGRFTTSARRVLAKVKRFLRLASSDTTRVTSERLSEWRRHSPGAWEDRLPSISSSPDGFASETNRRLDVLIARLQEADELISREEQMRVSAVGALRSDMIRSTKVIAVSGLGWQLIGVLLILVGTVIGLWRS